MEQRERTSFEPMEVDYDVYAEGEAELGWLNCQAHLQAPRAGGFPWIGWYVNWCRN
jgi:hypothetical protein